MTFQRFSAVWVAALMFSALGTTGAQASGPFGGCGAPFYYPFYAQYGREHIPYFALHPPVYYSYVVPRSYGYSPFAYPFGSPTPEIQFVPPKEEKKPEPKTMSNPHVTDVSHRDVAAQAAPRVIYNPFVDAPRVAGAR
jgi:hypothetical protein